MRKNKALITAAALISLTAITACTSTTGGQASNQTAAKKSVSKVTIGFDQRELDAPYYTAMVDEAKQVAQQDGFKLVVQNANSDPVTQVNQVQTMVAQGVDLVVVNAVSPQAEKAQLLRLAKKVPLMFIDTGIPGVGFTTVQSNNVAIGTLSGQLTAARIGKGKTINLAILNGGPTDEIVGPDRQKGFLAGLKDGGITFHVVASAEADYTEDKAVPATQDILSAHPDVNLIVGLNDSMTLGALKVLQQRHDTKVLVAAAADGQKQALQAIKTGGCHGQYISTGLNSPKLATDKVFRIAVSVTTGKSAPSSYPKLSYTKAAGINCKNVTQYYDPSSVF